MIPMEPVSLRSVAYDNVTITTGIYILLLSLVLNSNMVCWVNCSFNLPLFQCNVLLMPHFMTSSNKKKSAEFNRFFPKIV